MTRSMRFNAFDMNCVAHQSPGLWRHPEDQSARYEDLSYWAELANLLERGRFDGFNLAYAVTPGTFADFIEHVVPVLTERGAYQSEYAPGTLPSSTIIERPSTVPSSSSSVASQPTASR